MHANDAFNLIHVSSIFQVKVVVKSFHIALCEQPHLHCGENAHPTHSQSIDSIHLQFATSIKGSSNFIAHFIYLERSILKRIQNL